MCVCVCVWVCNITLISLGYRLIQNFSNQEAAALGNERGEDVFNRFVRFGKKMYKKYSQFCYLCVKCLVGKLTALS